MVYRFLFLVLFIGAGLSSAQQKYFVFFKDKGAAAPGRFYKAAQLAESASIKLSAESIDRRKQVMGEEYYVNYDDIPVHKLYIEEIGRLNIKIDKTLNWFNAVSCYLSQDEIQSLQKLPFVDKIEPVRKLKSYSAGSSAFEWTASSSAAIPFSPFGFNYGNTFSQNNLSGIPAVHDAGYSGNGVIVGVLDTGFELTSRAFSSTQVIAQRDFVFNDDNTANQADDWSSQHNHGTAVLSIMAGMDNGFQIGPAYGARFLLAKTEDVRSETHIEEDNYAAALEWMEARGVRITSSSLGYTTFDSGGSYTYQSMDGKTTIVTKAAELSFQRGVIVLTAAGNDGNNPWRYISAPADGFNTIAVGALTPSNTIASFSSRGPSSDGRIKPEICAQGTSIYHSLPLSTSYSSGQGTSYATPLVAGITALLIQAQPHLTNVQVRNMIIQSGDNSKTPNNDKGYGLLSAVKLLNFPSLKQEGNGYKLYKLLIGYQNITAGSVQLNYSVNSVARPSITFAPEGNDKYSLNLPALNNGDKIRFTVQFTSGQNTVTLPSTSEYYEFTYGSLLITDLSSSVVNNEHEGTLPSGFALYQNYPNPFNPSTVISYSLPANSIVTLKVFNIIGQEVAVLVNGQLKNAGSHKTAWDGKDIYGRQAAAGVYFYRMTAGGFSDVKKMVLVK